MDLKDSTFAGLGTPIFLDNEAKFERENKFGKRLFLFAWAVEILAASLGLLLSFFVAYDAFNKNSEASGSSILNAVMGALPFTLIAIIELTKIPLASGLYRVRNYGWKFLILIALVALTTVTFETMFTGLERQMTNITAKITDGKTKIQELLSVNRDLQNEIASIQARDINEDTNFISQQVEQIRADLIQKKAELNEVQLRERSLLEAKIQDLVSAKETMTKSLTSQFDVQIKTYSEQIQQLSDRVLSIQDQIDLRRQKITNNPRVDEINAENERILASISETENWLNSAEPEQISRAQVRIGVNQDGRFGPNTRRIFESWRQQRLAQIDRNTEQLETIRSEGSNDIQALSIEKVELQEKISSLRSDLFDAQAKRADVAKSIVSKPPTAELERVIQEIRTIQTELDELLISHNEDAKALSVIAQNEIEQLTESRRMLENNITEDKLRIPQLNQLVLENDRKISELENLMRVEARNNQVYRFAQKRGYFDDETGRRLSYEDILDVTEDDLSFVGLIWFGSIALICATMGTILALVANIMTDPDAFVEKQRTRKLRPVQRSLRLLLVNFRKRVMKRPTVIEKEVIKYVDVEKIKEVEKIVNKELEVLVPEIIPVPIFIPSDADHASEMAKASGYYDAINEKVSRLVKRDNDKDLVSK